MARLIDYEEARKLLDEQYKKTARLIRGGQLHLDNLAEGFLEADRVIQKLPEVDAVEVVRCRDCKHKGWIQEACHGKSVDYCHIWDSFINDSGKDFCSYGERRTDGNG